MAKLIMIAATLAVFAVAAPADAGGKRHKPKPKPRVEAAEPITLGALAAGLLGAGVLARRLRESK